MVLVWPNWFGLDRNDLVLTKIKWSRPKWIGQVQMWFILVENTQFGPDQFILVVTISFWSRPNHCGQVQINLIRPKQFWTEQNCFGHREGQGVGNCRHLKLKFIPSVGVGDPSLLLMRSLRCWWFTGEIVCGIWGCEPVAIKAKGLRGCIGKTALPGPMGPPRCRWGNQQWLSLRIGIWFAGRPLFAMAIRLGWLNTWVSLVSSIEKVSVQNLLFCIIDE